MSNVAEQPGLLTTIAAKRREVAIGLGALAVVFAALTVWWGVWGWKGRQALDKPAAVEAKPDDPFADPDKPKADEPPARTRSADYLPAAVWAFLLMVLAGGSAAWMYTQPLTPGVEGDTVRAEVLTFGAVSGLITTLLGVLLGLRWQDSLFKWVNDGSTREARWVLIAASIFTLGLVLMFLSLQLGRTQERANAVLRRMLYGFNSVFLGLLLFMVLLAVNVVSYLKVPTTLLTTDRAFTELSEESKQFLHKLDKPVRVYLVLPEKYSEPIQTRHGRVQYERMYTDCHVLLDQCEDESRFFHATYLSPSLDTARIAAVRDRLKVKIDDPNAELIGMIVAVGETEDAVGFIPAAELIESVQVGRSAFGVVFQAENRLLTEVAFLSDKRENEVIYFTQDNGELAMEGPGARSMANAMQLLRDRKAKVQALKLDEKNPEVPKDAAVVVVAGPQTPFAADGPTLKALQAYLRPTAPDAKPGRLMAFLPAVRGARGEVIPTGLESLAAEYGITVSPDRRLVTLPNSIPIGGGQTVPSDSAYVGLVADMQSPVGVKNPLLFKDCRPILPAPGGPGPYRPHPMLATRPRFQTWLEKDWGTAAATVVGQFKAVAGDEEAFNKLAAEKQLSRAAVTVAVASTEANKTDPDKPEKPRAIVFGSDSLLADQSDIDLRNDEYRALLFADLIDWLRERDANLGIPPRKKHVFELGTGPDLTGLLMLLAILIVGISGLGLGVWLSRRR